MRFTLDMRDDAMLKAQLKSLKDNGYKMVIPVDTNVTIDALYHRDIRKRVDYHMEKRGASEWQAFRHVVNTILSSMNFADAVLEWKRDTNAISWAMPVFADFIVDETENTIYNGSLSGSIKGPMRLNVREYLENVNNSEKGRCAYLTTPFCDKDARINAKNLLPERLYDLIRDYRSSSEGSKDNDMALYYTAHNISDKTDMMVGVLTRDSNLCTFIKEANKIMYTRILGLRPRNIVRYV